MSDVRSRHLTYMQRALELAARGKGWVSPNPCVGAVIVRKGRIAGEGFHERFGGPHAEVNALAKAGSKARGATLYLTLEPCVHWGKTPPCAPEVIRAGIKTVYIAAKDPNPIVAGRGIRTLRRAGIRVHVGLEEAAANRLNRSYVTWRRKKRPYVVLKAAMTLDGKIATAGGESKWITGQPARKLGHQLRAESDAIVVGANTVERDNPTLTSHGVGRDPLRVVFDPSLRTSPARTIYRTKGERTLIVTGTNAAPSRIRRMKKQGVQILRSSLKFNGFRVRDVLMNLSKQNVSQVLVEGGGETMWRFIREGLVDEVYFFVAPVVAGGRAALSPVEGEGFKRLGQAFRFKHLSAARVGSDLLLHGWQSASTRKGQI